MKKSLLFIAPSLECGGAERSLITLLSLLDSELFDVDLMLFRREGIFLEMLPGYVNIIDGGNDYKYFDGKISRCLFYCLKKGKPKLAFQRIQYLFALKRAESAGKRVLVWKCLGGCLPRLEKRYDASIGYLEGNATYYCVDKTTADKKIGYMHSDYEKLGMNEDFDKKYFNELDQIVTVSAVCAESLARAIPFTQTKTVVVENIISKAEVTKLAASPVIFEGIPGCINLLTVGRLSKEKGMDLAVGACEILVREGYNVCWYVVGTGELKDHIDKLIKEKRLENRFILSGQQGNPYPYIARCDIYVQPSRYEGKSIAIEEAKALERPIVTTKFTTVRDQIEDSVTGLIADINAASIADKIKLLINNTDIGEKLRGNLKTQSTGNEREIDKFQALIYS